MLRKLTVFEGTYDEEGDIVQENRHLEEGTADHGIGRGWDLLPGHAGLFPLSAASGGWLKPKERSPSAPPSIAPAAVRPTSQLSPVRLATGASTTERPQASPGTN